jgi:uncharacterized DUF497 family protein
VDFEWEPDKAEANRRKHGVDFADAVGVFDDPFALTQEDPHPSEHRFVTIGRDFLERAVLVSWLWRGQNIRLISARKATPRERRQYTEGLDNA